MRVKQLKTLVKNRWSWSEAISSTNQLAYYSWIRLIKKKSWYSTLVVGTFDVSILELGDGVFDVATAGDNKLGGDFDQKIIDYLVAKFQENGIDLSTDKALQRLKTLTEKTERCSGRLTSTQISLPFITAGEAGPLPWSSFDSCQIRRFDSWSCRTIQKLQLLARRCRLSLFRCGRSHPCQWFNSQYPCRCWSC